MTRKHDAVLSTSAFAALALAALVPTASRAQVNALNAARDTQKTSDAGHARVMNAADAAAASGNGTGRPAVPTDVEVRMAPQEGGATAADAGRGTVPPPDTYTVRPGDTLWDLSGRFLNNPWYWPKVWSYNPQITNPHWIEPGNLLRFYPAPDQGPMQVEPVAEAAPVEEEAPVAAPKELEDFSKADLLKQGPSAEEQDAVQVAGPYKIGQAPTRTLYAARATFVTPRELDESGTIKAAFAEKSMLSAYDRAYAQFKDKAEVKVGETYLIYRTVQPVKHPVTGELFGYQSDVLGAGKVVAVDDKAVTIDIVVAVDSIERGALLGPWTEKIFRPVPAKPNGRDLAGVIMASPTAQVTQLAETQVVFIDRGKADGVEEGNKFQVIRAGDPYGRPMDAVRAWDDRFPREVVGELLIVDVRENASAAMVTRSIVELEVGDRVEMRAARTAVGSAE
ncbi:MAG: LysM peptidoglycan-binding domain-containing protein [Anaeromyxobacter sp.]